MRCRRLRGECVRRRLRGPGAASVYTIHGISITAATHHSETLQGATSITRRQCSHQPLFAGSL